MKRFTPFDWLLVVSMLLLAIVITESLLSPPQQPHQHVTECIDGVEYFIDPRRHIPMAPVFNSDGTIKLCNEKQESKQ